MVIEILVEEPNADFVQEQINEADFFFQRKRYDGNGMILFRISVSAQYSRDLQELILLGQKLGLAKISIKFGEI